MINRKYIAPLAALAVAAAAVLGGCSTSKKASKTAASGNVTVAESTVASPAAAVVRLAEGYGDWTDVSLPVKLNLLEPKYISISGKAVMVRDSEIYISLRVLGFEAGGIYIDKDSVFVYEKLNKAMLAEPLSRITSLTGMTLGDIQDAILGRVFVAGEGTLDASAVKKFSLTAGDGIISMTPVKKQKNISLLFNITDAAQPALKSAEVDASGRATLDCSYSQSIKTAVGYIAAGMIIDAAYGKRKVKAGLEWTLTKAEWNRGASTKWRKPSGYTRLDFNKIVKMIGGE